MCAVQLCCWVSSPLGEPVIKLDCRETQIQDRVEKDKREKECACEHVSWEGAEGEREKERESEGACKLGRDRGGETENPKQALSSAGSLMQGLDCKTQDAEPAKPPRCPCH